MNFEEILSEVKFEVKFGDEMLRAQLEDRDKQIEFLKSLINK